jgi:hypothetical protein
MTSPTTRLVLAAALVTVGALAGNARAGENTAYPWLSAEPAGTILSRVALPPGWARIPAAAGSFGAWLRGLPVKPGRPEVLLFNGRKKSNQDAHHVVLEVDVGKRDLQQCADAAMRLRAEFLRQAGKEDAICFRFTNGTPARWSDWKQGLRPRMSRAKTPWGKSAAKRVRTTCLETSGP